MKKIKLTKNGFTLIEVMIVLAMILIIARTIYARDLYEWENNMWRAIGLSPEYARFALGIGALSYLVIRAIKERKERKKTIN